MTHRVALCGYPEAGKTEVQKYLQQRFGFIPIDDGRPLRDAARILYNLSEKDVTTQEGKRRLIRVGNDEITVRKALGDLGKYLEERDPFHLPRLAMIEADRIDPNGYFVFGSVRRDQPTFYASFDHTIVVEVVRDGCTAKNDFDEYLRGDVSVTIRNEVDPADIEGSRKRLHDQIDSLIVPRLACPRTAA